MKLLTLTGFTELHFLGITDLSTSSRVHNLMATKASIKIYAAIHIAHEIQNISYGGHVLIKTVYCMQILSRKTTNMWNCA